MYKNSPMYLLFIWPWSFVVVVWGAQIHNLCDFMGAAFQTSHFLSKTHSLAHDQKSLQGNPPKKNRPQNGLAALNQLCTKQYKQQVHK